MIKVTQLQRNNALSAKKMWNSVPEAKVMPGLNGWNSLSVREDGDGEDDKEMTPDCNTICCFGGWCAYWPEFRAQGVIAVWGGMPAFEGLYAGEVDKVLFGCDDLFAIRGEGDAEKLLEEKDQDAYDEASDWQIVMNRINWLIKNSVVTA